MKILERVQETFCKSNVYYKEILSIHMHIYIHHMCVYTDTHADNIKMKMFESMDQTNSLVC